MEQSSPIGEWDIFRNDEPVRASDYLKISFEIEGDDARRVITEAALRNITYNEMAKILVTQGLFYWGRVS